MANVSDLEINERSNVERANLRVATIENENWEDKASKFREAISKLANFWNFDSFSNSKSCGNLLIFQFRKFLKFLIDEISKIYNLEN